MLVPYDVNVAIFKRLFDLNERTPFVLRWYSFFIAFYDDPKEKNKSLIKELNEENDNYEKKK